jgi:uncharacterized protein (UPF0548 family)
MSEFTYPEVGATRRGELPAGYAHLHYRLPVGAGVRVMDTAAEAVLTWRMHRSAGVRVAASAPRAAEGVRVTTTLGIGPIGLRAPCRVVWVVDTGNEAGFGYGTLAGHPERGEESFVVEQLGDQVWFTVTAFSRPAVWYTRAGGPVVGWFQKAYARRLGATLRRLCATSGG